jgi:general secretion pathway protein H
MPYPLLTSSRTASHGFTLIELLVVMVIMGIALGAVVLQLLPDERAILREEAQRLALLLENAGLEARASGRSLAWTFDQNNANERDTYRFWHKNEYSDWVKIGHDPVFRARALADGVRITQVSIENQPLPAGEYLVLSAHSFALPFHIQLQIAHFTANVVGHSTGKVSVQLNDVQ